jgi:hypothetical protein
MEFHSWGFFERLSKKFKLYWKVTRITITLHEDHDTFWLYLARFFLEWKMFQVKFVKKIKTRILRSVTFFFRKTCRVWDNVEKVLKSRADHGLHSACALHAV